MPKQRQFVFVMVAAFFWACAPRAQHGKMSALSLATSEQWKACPHGVPEDVCVKCHPERARAYRDRGDWCEEHGVPESQCLTCNPDLDFSPPKAPPQGSDVIEIVHAGEDLPALEPFLARGRVTVFDFYAAWCTPCRKLDTFLYSRLAGDQHISIRKVNIVDWDSEAAQKWLKGVPELPYVIVYGKRGQRVAELHGVDFAALDRALTEAAR